MPILTFTRSTFNPPDLPNHDNSKQFHIDLTPYAKDLLQSRIQDAFRRKTRWIEKERGKKRGARGGARDRDFVSREAGGGV